MTRHFPTFETFAGREGETFTVTSDAGPIRLVLRAVMTWREPAGPEDRQPFTIHFVGPPESLLSQGMYRFAHDDIGSLDIFIVPLGPYESGMRYEAIFT